jgi:hypothetical protein
VNKPDPARTPGAGSLPQIIVYMRHRDLSRVAQDGFTQWPDQAEDVCYRYKTGNR